MSEREQERSDEHEVSPLELFFDLVFVSSKKTDPRWSVRTKSSSIGVDPPTSIPRAEKRNGSLPTLADVTSHGAGTAG